MNSNRTPGRDQERPRRGRSGDRRSGQRDGSVAQDASVPLESDENEGQLGPDELSEPEEVVMNLEAKRHH